MISRLQDARKNMLIKLKHTELLIPLLKHHIMNFHGVFSTK